MLLIPNPSIDDNRAGLAYARVNIFLYSIHKLTHPETDEFQYIWTTQI